MFFLHVCESFQQIEYTASRTEMTKQLSALYSGTTPQEARIITYLALGHLRPPYESTQFGLASKSITKVLADLFSTPVPLITKQAHELGDLGKVVGQGTWSAQKNLTVVEVYDRLTALEDLGGGGSQELKAQALSGLLKEVSPLEAQMIVRTILGQLRLGFSDMTLIDALSWMLVGDKSLHKDLENAYNRCADLGRIAHIVRERGVEGLCDVDIVIGIPIRPAAAERLPSSKDILAKLGHCVAQPKLDGFRLQVHIKQDEQGNKIIKFFSRNLIDMSSMFPDLVEAFKRYPISSLIIEGEAIVYDDQTGHLLPFQETVKRKRKHDIDEMVTSMPIKLFIFDILYYNGQSVLSKSHAERRALLHTIFTDNHHKAVSIIDEVAITTSQQLEDYFEQNIHDGFEGLVVKRPDALYQPGKRNFNWIKLKKSEDGGLNDTIDAVVLGYYLGKGKRATFGIGAFLVGVYDKAQDRFETIAKVGTGLKDNEWRDLKKLCDEKRSLEMPHNVYCAKELYPDVWVYPEVVCTVRADEITESPLHTAGKTPVHLGLALRFPRFVNYRRDKSERETTTVDEIKSLWRNENKRMV